MNAFEDDDEEEVVVMDENYETSVYVEVEEEKPLSAGDVFNALKNIGSKLTEKDDTCTKARRRKEGKERSIWRTLCSRHDPARR